MTLLVSLASYIPSLLTFAHFSRFTHIYNNNTSTLYHLAWEFEKPFIISFITLPFIQPKINELFLLNKHSIQKTLFQVVRCFVLQQDLQQNANHKYCGERGVYFVSQTSYVKDQDTAHQKESYIVVVVVTAKPYMYMDVVEG